MDQDLPLEERVDEFLNPISRDEALFGHETRAAVASMFLMGLDLTAYPTFRAAPFEKIESACSASRARRPTPSRERCTRTTCRSLARIRQPVRVE